MKKIVWVVFIALFLSSTISFAHADRLNCGRVMRKLTGGKYGPDYNLALNWSRLPRTHAHSGAVVVQRRKGKDSAGNPGGHVSLIRRVIEPCKAIVEDDKGTYKRNICERLVAYVLP